MAVKGLSNFILLSPIAFNFSLCNSVPTLEASDTSLNSYPLPTLTVRDQRTANLRPAATFESVISNLDFDPRIDFQSRNMAEAQGDVNIRGGIFESTGFQVGAATLFDPQTGHYSTELPIAPEMLSEPKVHTGVDNALRGFNSTAGTISYKWSKVISRGSATLGVGDNQLNFQRIYNANVQPFDENSSWTVGVEAEFSRSESDGTVPYSDHNFKRATARVQIIGPHSQTDFVSGYQSKFFGQFGMYTGDQYTAYNPYETEDIQTRLFILNHQQGYAEDSNWEASTYYRKNNDHYIFNRFSPNNNFVHETEALAFAFSGVHTIDDKLSLKYNLQVTADNIESSTLEQGDFTRRTYCKLSVLPQYIHSLNDKKSLIYRAGASLDDTNRDSSEFSPMAEISILTDQGEGHSQRTYLSYAGTTQVVGYGAIGGSETSGLFRSNHDLLRETTKNIEVGFNFNRSDWKLNSAIFYRWDKDLVDWTYSGSGARSAENMDLKTFGFEIIASRQWNKFEALASYAYLRKNEDYGNPAVVGSFYALNFPKHRATLGMIYDLNEKFEIRLDNELRDHRRNPLRTGANHALFSHLGISFYPNSAKDLEVYFAFDKPWDNNFQEIPGTPGRSDQLSLGMIYQW